MELLVLFGLAVLLSLIGAPIAVALGASSLVYLLVFGDETSLASVIDDLATAFGGDGVLLSIPFFILAASFLSTGGVARRFTRFAVAAFGSAPGGLAIAGVFACLLFAAVSGSSPATVVAIGAVVIAGIRQVGYSNGFAAGVIANAGALGILIPPSIVMVVYASVTDVSPARLFLAGIAPGLVSAGALMLTVFLVARQKGLPRERWMGWGEVASSASGAIWGLLIIAIVLGGLLSGALTLVEASAAAAIYAFLVATFIYRDMGPFKGPGPGGAAILTRSASALWHPDTRRALLNAAKQSAEVLLIIAGALVLKHVLVAEDIPRMIADVLRSQGVGPLGFLVILNVTLLVAGQFIVPAALVVIAAPLVFPLALELGVDPIHLGVVMIVNMEIAMITPPVGLNVFVTAGMADMKPAEVVRAAAPWTIVLVLVLGLVTVAPALSTWLPTLILGPPG